MSCPRNTILEGGKYGTALQAASDSGHVQIVDFLFQRGANLNVQGEEPFDSEDIILTQSRKAVGMEPPQSGLRKGHLDIVGMLLAAGADPNIDGAEFYNSHWGQPARHVDAKCVTRMWSRMRTGS
jgi:ankyrin repeat protein